MGTGDLLEFGRCFAREIQRLPDDVVIDHYLGLYAFHRFDLRRLGQWSTSSQALPCTAANSASVITFPVVTRYPSAFPASQYILPILTVAGMYLGINLNPTIFGNQVFGDGYSFMYRDALFYNGIMLHARDIRSVRQSEMTMLLAVDTTYFDMLSILSILVIPSQWRTSGMRA